MDIILALSYCLSTDGYGVVTPDGLTPLHLLATLQVSSLTTLSLTLSIFLSDSPKEAALIVPVLAGGGWLCKFKNDFHLPFPTKPFDLEGLV